MAWGEARSCERNPRYRPLFGVKARKGGRQVVVMHPLPPVSQAIDFGVLVSWGFARKASLYPRLYAFACFAGY
jgi:hypothetical protein